MSEFIPAKISNFTIEISQSGNLGIIVTVQHGDVTTQSTKWKKLKPSELEHRIIRLLSIAGVNSTDQLPGENVCIKLSNHEITAITNGLQEPLLF